MHSLLVAYGRLVAEGRIGFDWNERIIHIYTEPPATKTRDNPYPETSPIDRCLFWNHMSMNQGEAVLFIDHTLQDFIKNSWVGAWAEMLETHQKGEGRGRFRQIENDNRYQEWSEWV